MRFKPRMTRIKSCPHCILLRIREMYIRHRPFFGAFFGRGRLMKGGRGAWETGTGGRAGCAPTVCAVLGSWTILRVEYIYVRIPHHTCTEPRHLAEVFEHLGPNLRGLIIELMMSGSRAPIALLPRRLLARPSPEQPTHRVAYRTDERVRMHFARPVGSGPTAEV